MTLHVRRFALSWAIAMAILWLICAALVWLTPSTMMTWSGHVTHQDLSDSHWHLSVGGVLAGLIIWSVVAGAMGALVAVIYNWMAPKDSK